MLEIDLTGLSLDELVQLRGRVVAQIDRQTILEETPRQVGELVSRYTSAGGDPDMLRAALDTNPEGA